MKVSTKSTTWREQAGEERKPNGLWLAGPQPSPLREAEKEITTHRLRVAATKRTKACEPRKRRVVMRQDVKSVEEGLEPVNVVAANLKRTEQTEQLTLRVQKEPEAIKTNSYRGDA